VIVPRLSGAGPGPIVVTRLTPAGSTVRAGDVVVEFDPQGQQKVALDRRAELNDLSAQLARKVAEHDGLRTKDLAEIELAEHAVARARLDMLKNEMVSAIDAEKNTQALAEAEATLAMLRRVFELKRASEQAERRALEIQRDRAGASVAHAERNIALMTVRSRQDGLIVLKSFWKGAQIGEVQEGEEVRPGLPLLEVIDPSAMQVRARVNQVDLRRLRVGMAGTVTLDAYPQKRFPARLERLSPAGTTSVLSPRIRTFAAVFSIAGADPALLPDLSAAIDLPLDAAAHGAAR
jgi:multidrug resistance efflux pump